MYAIFGMNTPNMGERMYVGFAGGFAIGMSLMMVLGLSIGPTTHDLGLTLGVAGGLCAGSMVIGPVVPLLIHKVRNSLDEHKQITYEPHQGL